MSEQRSHHHVQYVHTEPVVMDIGEGMGSLIVYTAPELRGREYEISPKGDDALRAHTDVAERRVNGRTIFAAVYLPMPAGEYTLWGPDPEHPTAVTIVAGQIVELNWR